MIAPTVETAPFWTALAENRLLARRCNECGRIQPTPRRICRCGSEAGEWIALPAIGRLESWTTVAHAPPDRSYLPSPYTLAIVSFPDTDHRMMALLDVAKAPPVIGAMVDFAPYRQGEIVLPGFATRVTRNEERSRA